MGPSDVGTAEVLVEVGGGLRTGNAVSHILHLVHFYSCCPCPPHTGNVAGDGAVDGGAARSAHLVAREPLLLEKRLVTAMVVVAVVRAHATGKNCRGSCDNGCLHLVG